MRLISFSKTEQQFRDRIKDVTRRLGWKDLQPGTLLCGVRKAMGLRKGEQVERLGVIRVVSVRMERLDVITHADVAREGFPNMTPADFVTFFCAAMGCNPTIEVTRIEFEHVCAWGE